MTRRLKACINPATRASLRQLFRDLPVAVRDFPADLFEQLFPPSLPLPPARLRRRVALTGSRADFLANGQRCARDVLDLVESLGREPSSLPRWLDFGCGCGRITRHLIASGIGTTGVDVDRSQIRWAARHLPGQWLPIAPQPPLPFPPASFDAVVSISVFTHLDEESQLSWLAELRRVLKPQGLFIASTHGPKLVVTLPQPFGFVSSMIESAGFVHLPSRSGFNYQVTFHSAEYLERQWTRFFAPLAFLASGLNGYHDLSVWTA
jgi:SAM-dependent methyltransferase